MTDTQNIDTNVETNVQAEAPAHLKNDKRFSDAMKQIKKFGEETALGKDALPKLAMYVVRLATDGVIDAETKNAKGDDSAQMIYDAYVAAESNKAVHEHTGTKANVSKLRQLIKLGCLTTIDAVELMQDAMEVRDIIASNNKDKKEGGIKIKPAYPFYVEVARAQLDAPQARIDRDTLGRMVGKDEPKETTVESELKRAMKILEGLVTGEGKAGKDEDDMTELAFNAIRDRVTKMENARKLAALHVEAAKLGIKLA